MNDRLYMEIRKFTPDVSRGVIRSMESPLAIRISFLIQFYLMTVKSCESKHFLLINIFPFASLVFTKTNEHFPKLSPKYVLDDVDGQYRWYHYDLDDISVSC